MSAEPLQLGTAQGCQFNLGVPNVKVLCMKVCDDGQQFCPFHRMLIDHNATLAAKKEAAQRTKRGADIRRKARR